MICGLSVLSAMVFGGAEYILRVLGGVVDGVSVVIFICAVVYPEAMAVMVAVPGALLVTAATAQVWPSLIVAKFCTEAMVLFVENRSTVIPCSGAFAGLLLESWSSMIMALYWLPSAGRTGGKPCRASFVGTGAIVVIFAWTVA